jgi:hypothetical protein
MRATSTRVLPVPAPAMTRSGPSAVRGGGALVGTERVEQRVGRRHGGSSFGRLLRGSGCRAHGLIATRRTRASSPAGRVRQRRRRTAPVGDTRDPCGSFSLSSSRRRRPRHPVLGGVDAGDPVAALALRSLPRLGPAPAPPPAVPVLRLRQATDARPLRRAGERVPPQRDESFVAALRRRRDVAGERPR